MSAAALTENQLIIRKEPVISEVVKIRRRTIGETKRISKTVRHEELRVDHEGNAHIVGDDKEAA